MAKIKVSGMTCQHCVKSVTDALNALDGVSNVSVDLDSGVAEYDADQSVSREVVREAIRKIGFVVEE